MKFKSLAVGTLCIALATAPMAASAHGRHDGGLVFGLIAGTAAVAVAALTLPFALAAAAAPPVAYAPPPPPAYYAQSPAGYAPSQGQPQGYYPPPSSGYYAQGPVYYAAPYYYR